MANFGDMTVFGFIFTVSTVPGNPSHHASARGTAIVFVRDTDQSLAADRAFQYLEEGLWRPEAVDPRVSVWPSGSSPPSDEATAETYHLCLKLGVAALFVLPDQSIVTLN